MSLDKTALFSGVSPQSGPSMLHNMLNVCFSVVMVKIFFIVVSNLNCLTYLPFILVKKNCPLFTSEHNFKLFMLIIMLMYDE